MVVVIRSGQAMMSAPVQRFVDDLRYGGDTGREASAVVPVKFGDWSRSIPCISTGDQWCGQYPPTWSPNSSAPVNPPKRSPSCSTSQALR